MKTFYYLFSKAILLGMALGLAACSHTPYPQSKNYDQEAHVFQNSDGSKNNKGFFELLGLASSYFSRPDDPHEKTGFPAKTWTKEELTKINDEVIWIGHASLLLNHNGVNVLTDPVFSDRASPFQFAGPKRASPLPFAIKDLPKIDIVLISHSHYDHLDKGAIIDLSRYQPDAQYFVPLGLKSVIESWGAKNVTEMDWWDEVDYNGIRLTATPMKHWSSRTPFDRNKTLWAGFKLDWPDFSFYFIGDTGYTDDYKTVRERLGTPDLVGIPIGAYNPRDFMKDAHVNPEEAVQILKDLGAPKAVPLHWGTFKLTLEPLAEPPERLRSALDAAQLSGQDFVVLQHGGTTSIR